MDLQTKIKEFNKKTKFKEDIDKAWVRHGEFLKLYPFRKNPGVINSLTAEQVYNPRRSKDYFFNWVEHKLKPLGHLAIGSARVWQNAKDGLEVLKQLLKIITDDSLSVANKIDAHWEDIKGFGKDKHIAKKILFCYYPEVVIPIFKTEDAEDLSETLKLEYREKSFEKYGQAYETLSVGQKFELFSGLFSTFKNQHSEFKKWDPCLFVRFLYESFPVPRIRRQGNNRSNIVARRTVRPFSAYGLIAEPKFEQEVVFLFSKYHIKLGFPMITKIAPAFPDAEAINDRGEHKKIEFEVFASDFLNHGHDPKKCDYIICWEDDLDEEEKKRKELPSIISLKEELGD